MPDKLKHQNWTTFKRRPEALAASEGVSEQAGEHAGSFGSAAARQLGEVLARVAAHLEEISGTEYRAPDNWAAGGTFRGGAARVDGGAINAWLHKVAGDSSWLTVSATKAQILLALGLRAPCGKIFEGTRSLSLSSVTRGRAPLAETLVADFEAKLLKLQADLASEPKEAAS